ncbi:MAG: HAMP domain-containing histidine kinase [Proteobacteria bacterium]|nr:HAMP domain-containing histidine kinase [Pseudomonadota bacterium]
MIHELAKRLILLRAGGIALLAILLSAALALKLPLAYPNLFMIGIEWLALHSMVLLSQRKWQITTTGLTLQLTADVIVVASLLAFSGGAHNPFFALLLLPLLLTVGILPLLSQYLLLSVILTAATLLILVPAPISNTIPQLPNALYALLFTLDGGIVRDAPFNPLDVLAKLGLWLNLILIATITAFFLSRLHQRLQNQQVALKQAEINGREHQYLLNMSLAAAATAHELSTPLASISLLASEAQDAYQHNESEFAQQALMQIQQLVQQCKKQISHSLRQHQLERSDQLGFLPWNSYLDNILLHWQALRPTAQVTLNIASTQSNMPDAIDFPALTQSIVSLLNNACDASTQPVQINFTWNSDTIHLCIYNEGTGFPDGLLATFPQPQLSEKTDGHGMGLALAYASVLQLGGQLALSNPKTGGAQACITLPNNPLDWQLRQNAAQKTNQSVS